MYLTAAMTGLRQGELVALRWRDVDWTAGRIRVRQNYVLGEFGTPKSRRSTRNVPIVDEVAGELDRLSSTVGESSGDALVFADPHTAGPLDKAAILRRFRRALKAASLSSRIASTICATRSARRWLGQAFPCGRCKSGWASGHRDNPALRGLLAECARVGVRGGGLRVGREHSTARLAGDVTALEDA